MHASLEWFSASLTLAKKKLKNVQLKAKNDLFWDKIAAGLTEIEVCLYNILHASLV